MAKCVDDFYSSLALVKIKCNATGIISYNQPIELNCILFKTLPGPNIVYNWTSTKFKQPQMTASVTVVATGDSVEYTCTVTDGDEKEYASIYVFSVGE